MSTDILPKPAVLGSTATWVMGCLVLISDIFPSAVIVGCLPPFKLLFEKKGFRRYNSPNYDENMSPGLQLHTIRLGRAGSGYSAKAAPKVMSRPMDRKQHVSGCGYGGGHDVPRGAIGVRIDYVSGRLGRWEIEVT